MAWYNLGRRTYKRKGIDGVTNASMKIVAAYLRPANIDRVAKANEIRERNKKPE